MRPPPTAAYSPKLLSAGLLFQAAGQPVANADEMFVLFGEGLPEAVRQIILAHCVSKADEHVSAVVVGQFGNQQRLEGFVQGAARVGDDLHTPSEATPATSADGAMVVGSPSIFSMASWSIWKCWRSPSWKGCSSCLVGPPAQLPSTSCLAMTAS